MIGETVGNYRITRLIGEGGMGAVYLAEHPGIGRKAVVKVLHPHLTRSAELANRFFNEARAANAIGHPGIVDVLDFGTLASGVSYIVMEFLPGESLAARLRRGRPPLAAALDIVHQVASALEAAHVKGIVHRDLKPDNLFLVPDKKSPGNEIVKVLDFGIAKLGAQADSGSVKTRTGAVMGTPAYMSPEQCLGTKEIDLRTDIYALGIVLYEMLCGEPPFVSEGQGELIHLQISARPIPPRSLNPEVPAAIEKVVLHALEKDPARRFQSMAELQQALRGEPIRPAAARPVGSLISTAPFPSVEGGGPMTTLSGGVSVLEARRARPRRLWLWAALGSLGVGVAAGFWVRTSKIEAPAPATAIAPSAPVAAPPAAPPPAPAPTPPPAPPAPVAQATVRIEVRAPIPAGLQVTRDGMLADLPVRIPRGPSVSELRFDAPGYETYSVRVDGSQDRRLVLPMRKLATSHGSHRPRPAGGAARAPQAVAAPAPAKPVAPPPPPAAEPAPRKSKLITDF